jgi:hypothetical protein
MVHACPIGSNYNHEQEIDIWTSPPFEKGMGFADLKKH